MTVSKNFSEAAQSLYGCDGGNLNSSVWICGLEWGGQAKHDLSEVIKVDAPIGWDSDDETIADCLQSEGMGYNQKIAWLFSYLFNWDISDYVTEAEKYRLMCHQGVGFKMNMFPLSFENRNNINWTEAHKSYSNLNGFDEYKRWTIENRGKYFQNLVLKHNPKLIVCTGITSDSEFMAFFDCDAPEQHRIYNDQMRLCLGKINNGKTMILVVPFFGGPSGINSYKKMEALSNFIRDNVQVN